MTSLLKPSAIPQKTPSASSNSRATGILKRLMMKIMVSRANCGDGGGGGEEGLGPQPNVAPMENALDISKNNMHSAGAMVSGTVIIPTNLIGTEQMISIAPLPLSKIAS